MTKAAWETDKTALRFESTMPAGLAQAVPDLQVARLPGSVNTAMPLEFGTPKITGLYEDDPRGPVVPYRDHNGPQLGGHNSGHGPEIEIEPQE